MPRWVVPTLAVLTTLSLIPFFLIARARATRFDKPRIHLILDMDVQQKFKAQAANPMFADGRAMRLPPGGTVARGEARLDEHFHRGVVADAWATEFPQPVTEATMLRGQARFEIYCSPCHGLDGAGTGVVSRRAEELAEGTWVRPLSYHDATVRARPVGHLFNTITNGIRTMPAYGSQIPESDRWAIVAYVRALQRTRDARINDVPPDVRPSMP